MWALLLSCLLNAVVHLLCRQKPGFEAVSVSVTVLTASKKHSAFRLALSCRLLLAIASQSECSSCGACCDAATRAEALALSYVCVCALQLPLRCCFFGCTCLAALG